MNDRQAPATPLGTALALALGPAAAQGLSRFAYALLLPGMRADLGWTLAQAGGVASANAVGYLAGALLTGPFAARLGLRRVFALGLLGTVLTLAAPADATGYTILLAIRAAAGVTGALAFVAGGAIAARLAAAPGQPSPMSIYFAGGGFGIALSGLGVPWLLHRTGGDWRLGWLLLALIAAACGAAAVRVARGGTVQPLHLREEPGPTISLRPAHLSYGLFGAGYVAYMTFVIALLHDRGAGEGFQALFWVVLGGAAALGSFAWRRLPVSLGGKRELALTNAVTALGVLLILPSQRHALELTSALLFGGSFLAVVGAVTALARSLRPPAAWTHVIGTLTGAFALGQCTGPVVAGALSDRPGGIASGLLLSAGLLLLAAVIALAQPTNGKV